MKEYEKLSEEFIESKMVDPIFASFMKMSWQIGFLKCREMALDKYESHDMFGYFLIYLKTLGEKEV